MEISWCSDDEPCALSAPPRDSGPPAAKKSRKGDAKDCGCARPSCIVNHCDIFLRLNRSMLNCLFYYPLAYEPGLWNCAMYSSSSPLGSLNVKPTNLPTMGSNGLHFSKYVDQSLSRSVIGLCLSVGHCVLGGLGSNYLGICTHWYPWSRSILLASLSLGHLMVECCLLLMCRGHKLQRIAGGLDGRCLQVAPPFAQRLFGTIWSGSTGQACSKPRRCNLVFPIQSLDLAMVHWVWCVLAVVLMRFSYWLNTGYVMDRITTLR